MLGPAFAEGQRDLDETDPLILPDDEYGEFLDFAKSLHLQTLEPDVSTMIGVAVVAGKYGCAPQALRQLLAPVHLAFGPSSSVSITALEEMGMSVLDVAYLALLADDEALLWRASRWATVKLETNVLAELDLQERLSGVSGSDLCNAILGAREAELQKLTLALSDPIRRVLDGVLTTHDEHFYEGSQVLCTNPSPAAIRLWE